MSSRSNTGKPEEDASTISDGGSSKGSNHQLGNAVSGAMHKLASPIAGIRKVIRKDSDYSETPRSSERKAKSFDFNDRSGHHFPMKDVSDFFGESGKAVKRLVHRNKDASSRSIPESDDEEQDSDLPTAPPDETLSKMNIIISKCLKGVSISNYYENVWNEHDADGKEPLYRSFLEESGKENIIVGKWQTAEVGNEFVGDWDGEKYTQKRTVTFVFDKKIPLQSKPVVAQVMQTHYCRMEGEARCVVAMTIDMQNVPFSDCFNVELRWVASRSGNNDCIIEVGLFVNFIKSTVLAAKIRNGTTQQTTQQQLQLFDKVLEACGATVEEVSQDEDAAPCPPSPLPAVKLTQDDAGRILVLSGCLLGVASQADCLFHQSSRDTAQMQLSPTAITSILAGLVLLVPKACWLTDVPCLLVVIAHLANGLCTSVVSECGIITTLSTVLLIAAWLVLAWGVWRQGGRSKDTP